MSVIVTDAGFAANDTLAGLSESETLTLPSDTTPWDLTVAPEVKLVRVEFPSSADGRGFTIAKALRKNGYAGHLRASGHVIADQYAMARRMGFDDVEISDALAARQPEEQWKFRADWKAHSYQDRLKRA